MAFSTAASVILLTCAAPFLQEKTIKNNKQLPWFKSKQDQAVVRPDGVVDGGLVLEEVGPDDAVVDDGGALEGGHAPQEEGALRGETITLNMSTTVLIGCVKCV